LPDAGLLGLLALGEGAADLDATAGLVIDAAAGLVRDVAERETICMRCAGGASSTGDDGRSAR
jgi:hypothetical protein